MRARFDELLALGEQAIGADDFEGALFHFEEAERIAREVGEVNLADRAFCNRCSVLVELDRGADQIPKLKEILLRSDDTRNRFLAAYCTGVAYYISEDLDRAGSYVRRATGLARELGDQNLERRSLNLVGTLAARDSRFDEAEEAFRLCLEAHRGVDGYQRVMAAQVEDNLGYVMMCTDRLSEGLRHCEAARMALQELGAESYLYEVLQDLCYGYVLVDDLDRAFRCGTEALELAVEHSDQQITKNCLFLLSEIAVRRGDTFGARRYLHELTAYYPEAGISEDIIDVFLATDLTTVVNLRGSR
jgi:tetratricopeptide (TPR) repeat protein